MVAALRATPQGIEGNLGTTQRKLRLAEGTTHTFRHIYNMADEVRVCVHPRAETAQKTVRESDATRGIAWQAGWLGKGHV